MPRSPWSDVDAVEVRERGTARRVVLVRAGGRPVLPVPADRWVAGRAGASIPGSTSKVELIRRWWDERRSP